MTTAADCTARIRALYGTDLEAPGGTLHVAAVAWEGEGDGLPTLRITAQTPRSATDRFVLGLARARADAVLTTGQILRDEPALEHRYHEERVIAAALAAWRSERLGKPLPPVSVVLTSGRGLDFAHPLFAGPAPVWILTTETAAAALRARVPKRHRVVGANDLTPRRALAYLRGEAGFETVSIEAGASTTASLYRWRPQVSELWLSAFESGGLPKSLRGPAFASAARLLEIFGPPRSRHVEQEASGRWSFSRFC